METRILFKFLPVIEILFENTGKYALRIFPARRVMSVFLLCGILGLYVGCDSAENAVKKDVPPQNPQETVHKQETSQKEVQLEDEAQNTEKDAENQIEAENGLEPGKTTGNGSINQEELDKYLNDEEYMFEHLKLDEPICENVGELVRLLPEKPLWINKERTQIVLQGWVCQNKVMLEFFLCSGTGGIRTFPYQDETGKPAKMLQFNGPKCHESVLCTEVPGKAIHTALLALGVEPGQPVQFQPQFTPPTGGEVKVTVRWRKPDGTTEEHRGQELVVDAEGKAMNLAWVFAGSMFFEDSEGVKRYAADMEGEYFGVSNFPSLILDVPESSTSANDSLIYTANQNILPERGTPVTIILEKK